MGQGMKRDRMYASGSQGKERGKEREERRDSMYSTAFALYHPLVTHLIHPWPPQPIIIRDSS
jgi:hypothetical protein